MIYDITYINDYFYLIDLNRFNLNKIIKLIKNKKFIIHTQFIIMS